MEQLQFEVKINADAEVVSNKMLSKDTYEQWTALFHPGSTYEGSWSKGSKIYFLGPAENGRRQGMVARISENIPGRLITISHMGFVDGEEEITTGPAVEGWAGGIEEYSFDMQDGITTVQVRVDVTDDHKAYFKKTWPLALDKLKTICEHPDAT